jgi:predicted nucleic acid-binding protein|tara:strand:- start:210 stop:608 length:399 start_codon:yes stop_codon:yes gene_type:complete
MIFLDSSVIIAYYNEKDKHHNRAVKIIKTISSGKEDIIINENIFNECVTVLFLRLRDLQKVITIGETLKKVPTLMNNTNLFNKTWETFKNQKDTKLSFTNCSIIATMIQERILSLATFDQDFSKIKDIKIIN